MVAFGARSSELFVRFIVGGACPQWQDRGVSEVELLASFIHQKIWGERGGSHAEKFIWGPKVGKMQHGLNVSERYVRHGFLASVRRSEFGKVFVLRVLHQYFAFADLGRVVLPPRRGSALP